MSACVDSRRARPGLAWLLVAAGCGHHHAPPLAPAPPPVQIEAVFPPDRSTGIDLDTAIWARFKEPLDPSTVTDKTVFLKLDTRRLPIAVRWEAGSRRISIVPLGVLGLRRTHTVELAPGIRTAGGTSLGTAFSWQFRTVGVGPPRSPRPFDRALGESPHAALLWIGSESIVDPIVYDVFIGSDSMQVAMRAVAPLRVGYAYLIPRDAWPPAAAVFWSVTAINLSTGDARSGPVWRFETMPAGSPVESIVLTATEFGTYNPETMSRSCGVPQLYTGEGAVAAIRWNTSAVGGPRKIASAEIQLSATTTTAAGASVWLITQPWDPCEISSPGPPFTDEVNGRLADGVLIATNTFSYRSDALASHVEATLRDVGFDGYLFRSDSRLSPRGSSGLLKLSYFVESGSARLAITTGR